MTSLRKRNLLVALALCAAAPAARAQLAMSHAQTLYADGAGGPLKEPEGVACGDAVVVVADTGNKRLVRYDVGAAGVTGGSAVKLAQIASPARVELDPKGNLLVLDGKTHRIARLDPAGAFQAWVDVKGAKGAAVAAAFKAGAGGELYVLDAANRAVLVADANGVVSREVALPADRKAVFTDVAVDPAGTLYAVDAVSATIWSADRSATAFKALSKGLKEFMNFPTHLTVDRGTLLVVDQYGHGVVVVGIDGSYQGRQLAMGWTEGLVYYPAQLCVNRSRTAFVADRYNNRVQAFKTGK